MNFPEEHRAKHPNMPLCEGEPYGYFIVRITGGVEAHCIATAGIPEDETLAVEVPGADWEHVSVHIRETFPSGRPKKMRVPNWYEMEKIKRLFWPDQVVMQLHVPSEDHINDHDHVLHLWRPKHTEIPTPPKICV